MGDADLIKLFASMHDEAAFAALVERHGPMVLGICRRILRNSADADDAFQATFILLAMRAGKIRQPHLLGNWLFGVATRTALNVRRTNQRRAVQEKRLMKLFRHKRTEGSSDVEWRLTVDEEISRLPEKYRQVIVSCYLQGMTKREAAEHLKWPEGTVATRLGHGLQLLRKHLGENAGTSSSEALATALAPFAVPAALSGATIKVAMLTAAGKVAGAAAISAKAIAAAKATSKAMLVAKIKLAAAVVITSAVALTGTSIVAKSSHRAERPLEVSYASGAPVRLDAPPLEPTAQVASSSAALALPAEVARALRLNADQIDPIAVTWTTEITTDMPIEQAMEKLKVSRRFFASGMQTLYWQSGKLYYTSLPPDGTKNEVAFDGEILYLGNSGGGQTPTLSKRRNADVVRTQGPNDFDRGFTWLWDGYFRHCGLQIPSTSQEMQTGRANSEVLWLLERGGTIKSIDTILIAKESTIRIVIERDDPERTWADKNDRAKIERVASGMTRRGRQQLIETWEQQKKLPLKRDCVFYLDPKLQYAVVRRQERYGQRLLLDTINDGFEQLPGRSVWLPATSTTQSFTSSSNPGVFSEVPLYTQICQVTDKKRSVAPIEQFVLDYRTPGTRISDQTVPGKPTSYVVHAGSPPPTQPMRAERTPALPQSYQPLADVPEAPQSLERHSTVLWSIVGVATALAVIAAWKWIAHRSAGRMAT